MFLCLSRSDTLDSFVWSAEADKEIKMMSMMSTSSLALLVEKATNDLLNHPDWAMNVEICDHINSHPWHGKDFVKAVKKRLQHKNPKIQFLALTLLETMVKNCGDLIHFKVAEKNIPREMVKMVKKRAEMNVHDKILLLLDAWQEAFGGPSGKHPQYYYAYDELRRSGIPFPKRSADDEAPILTPPPSKPNSQVGNGLERLEKAMATEIEGLSISTMGSTQNVMELLDDMLRAVNPKDIEAINDEIIIDLVNQCRANQKKLMKMLSTTNNEEILSQGLKLNDSMQNLLSKHDSIAFGIPLTPILKRSSSHRPNKQQVPSPKDKEPVVYPSYVEEKEDNDDYAHIGNRQSKVRQPNFEISTSGEISSISSPTPSSPSTSTCCSCKTLALSTPPPTKSPQEQDLIDLLSLTITTTPSQTPQTPSPNQNTTHQPPNPFTPHPTTPYGHVSAPYDSYIAPWAQPNNCNPQPLMTQQFQSPNLQPQYFQPMPPHTMQPQYSSSYNNNPPAEHYYAPTNQNAFNSSAQSSFGNPNWPAGLTNTTYQQYSSLSPARANGNATATVVTASTINITQPRTAHKSSFIPSYRLFEELNVMGGAEGRLKVSNGVSPSLTGNSSQNMVGGGSRLNT